MVGLRLLRSLYFLLPGKWRDAIRWLVVLRSRNDLFYEIYICLMDRLTLNVCIYEGWTRG